MFKTRRLAVAGLATVAATAALASPASAVTTPQQVAGVPGNVLALGVATPFVALTGFQPGSTATGSGSVLVTSTNPSWSLTVADLSANNGHLGKDGAARNLTDNTIPLTSAPILQSGGVDVVCPASSQATTNNPMDLVSSTGGLTGASAGALSNVDRLVATGNLVRTVNVNFSLDVGATENIANTCLYDTTLTYTVQ